MSTKLGRKKNQLLALTRSKGFVKYFQNTSWLVVDRVVNLAIAFGVGVLVARYLGPGDYGLLSFATSVGGFFVVVGGLGLEAIVIRELLNQPKAKPNILGSAVGLRLLSSGSALVLYTIFGLLFIQDRLIFWMIFFQIASIVLDAATVITYYFQSQVQAKFTARVTVFKIASLAIVKLLLIWGGFPLIYFAAMTLLESLIGMAGLVWIFSQKGGVRFSQWTFDRQYAVSLLQDAWPLMFSGFVIFVYNQSDVIMIKYLLGNEGAGEYTVAFKFTSIWFFVGTIACSSLFPAIVNAKKNSERLYQDRILQLMRLLAGLGLGIAIFVSLISHWMIAILYGNAYQNAASVIDIQIWSIIFVFIGVVASRWYIVENLQKLNLQRTILGAVINVILNFWLIPVMGIVGAAVATLAAQSVASFFGNAISARTRSLFFMQCKALTLFWK